MSDDALLPADGGVLAVPGLRGAAVKTGVKPSGAPDLAVIVADEPMSAAGMFTTCATAAAPVHLCREVLAESDTVRGIVINSGNANALTGPDGATHAASMGTSASRHAGGPALVLSTGVIGVPLPIDKVLAGMDQAFPAATPGADADAAVAQAMLTTDTMSKQAACRVQLSTGEVVVGGTAKGSGMIHPNMATMLAVIATDARVHADVLRPMLRRAVDHSFHQISVDGDTSTNDAVLLLARHADDDVISEGDIAALESAVTFVARRLAEKIIEDGEGRTRTLEIRVEGAATDDDATAIATAIATSSLVKTALAGGDPNWGRILSAAGNAGVSVDVPRLRLDIEGLTVFDEGAPRDDVDADDLGKRFSADRVAIDLHLGAGEASARMLTTDLTHRYVTINAEYTT